MGSLLQNNVIARANFNLIVSKANFFEGGYGWELGFVYDWPIDFVYNAHYVFVFAMGLEKLLYL